MSRKLKQKPKRMKIQRIAKSPTFEPKLEVKLWSPEKGGKATEVHLAIGLQGKKTLALRFSSKNGLRGFVAHMLSAGEHVWPDTPSENAAPLVCDQPAESLAAEVDVPAPKEVA